MKQNEVDIKSLFDEILLAKNKKQKINIIKKFAKDHKYVKSLLVLITHDGLNHTITKNAMKKLNIVFSQSHNTNIPEFLTLVKKLNKTKDRKERYDLISEFLSKCDRDRGYYYELILSDSLKIGIGRKTIDDIFVEIKKEESTNKVKQHEVDEVVENKSNVQTTDVKFVKQESENKSEFCMEPVVYTSLSDEDLKLIKHKYDVYEPSIKGDRCILVFDNKTFTTYTCDNKKGVFDDFFKSKEIFSYYLITILQGRVFDGKIFGDTYYIYDVFSTEDLKFGMGQSKYGLKERKTILAYLVTLINSESIKFVEGFMLKDFTKEGLTKLSKDYKNELSSGIILKPEYSVYRIGKKSNVWIKLDL